MFYHNIISLSLSQATHVLDTSNGNGREDKLDSIKAEVEKLNCQYNNLFSVIRKMQINCWEALMNSRPLEDGRITEGCDIIDWLLSIGHINKDKS